MYNETIYQIGKMKETYNGMLVAVYVQSRSYGISISGVKKDSHIFLSINTNLLQLKWEEINSYEWKNHQHICNVGLATWGIWLIHKILSQYIKNTFNC